MADLRASGLGGVPKGETADRPDPASVGDVFYNGTLAQMEIYTDSGWSPLGGTPGSPSIGNATYQSGRAYNSPAASVSFTPNTSYGLASLYTAVSSPGGIAGTGSSSPVIVSGLSYGTEYTFTVTATNSYGSSLASSSSNSYTPATVPQAPIIGTASDLLTGSVSLSFTAGATGDSTITNYKYSTDGVNYTAFSPQQTTSPVTISGLTFGNTYSFYLKAVNAVGDSAASSVSNSVTLKQSKATGGTLTADSTYIYHTFRSGGNFIPSQSFSGDVLVVAGGGGAALPAGGAGGLVYHAGRSMSSGTTYAVTVGNGGPSFGGPGSNSTFDTITALGGGGGGSGQGGSSVVNGGSGGGSGVATQGNSGGGTGYGNNGGGGTGGGGGAGAAGSGKNGGIGRAYTEFGAATGTGHNVGGTYYYAGGGGAYADGIAGSGSGSDGRSSTFPPAPAAHSGGGGGGSGYAGRNGAAGVVIVRYTA